MLNDHQDEVVELNHQSGGNRWESKADHRQRVGNLRKSNWTKTSDLD